MSQAHLLNMSPEQLWKFLCDSAEQLADDPDDDFYIHRVLTTKTEAADIVSGELYNAIYLDRRNDKAWCVFFVGEHAMVIPAFNHGRKN